VQIKGLTQGVEALRAANAWLLEQRDAWEQAARTQEAQAAALTQALLEQRNEWEQVAAERERKNDDLTKELFEVSRTVSTLESQRTEREQYIASLLDERNQILNTTSWKITKPLRFIGRRLSLVRLGFSRKKDSQQQAHPVPPDTGLGLSPMLPLMGQTHRILLVLHEYSRTGAPRAVLYLARAIFLLSGIRPVVIAPADGPIREEFQNEGFPTLVNSALFDPASSSSEIIDWVSGFEHVIVTPLASFAFVRHFKGSIKRLTWWLHEEALGFAYIADNFSSDLASLFDACDAVWLGSPLCIQPVTQYAAKEKLHLLLYGCDDIATTHQPHASGRIVFTLAGSVEPRKGQDIFLRAIEQLKPEVRRRAVFRMVGSSYNEWSANFEDKVYAQASQVAEIEFIPNVPFEELRRLYAQTDVVVSSSRADPMPISITQGLMFSKVCLCSSAIGHAQLLEDGKNGLIFTNESVEQLAEKIAWLIENPDEFPALGVSGRAVYEKYFRMDGFIRNVSALLNENRKAETAAPQAYEN
jgi:glycosyltransferase involved in cell wall biosynthesis